MITGTKRILALLGVSLLSVQLCTAQAPSGEITVPVADPPVYYLAGEWPFTHVFTGAGGADLPIEYGVALTHDARGRVSGEGMTWLRIGEYYGAAEYRAKGSVSGGSGKPTRLTLSVTIKGQDMIAGVDTTFSVTMNYALNISGPSAVGTARGKANLKKLGSASLRMANFTMARPDQGTDNYPTGAWSAHMSILPLKKLTGTGSFVVAPVVLPATLSGKYSEKKDEGSVTLKGINQGKGSTVKFSFAAGQLAGLKGVVLGQRVR